MILQKVQDSYSPRTCLHSFPFVSILTIFHLGPQQIEREVDRLAELIDKLEVKVINNLLTLYRICFKMVPFDS